MSRTGKELFGVVRGVQSVLEAALKLQEDALKVMWENSSIRNLRKECNQNVNFPVKNLDELVKAVNDGTARVNTVVAGLREFLNYTPPVKDESNTRPSQNASKAEDSKSPAFSEVKGFEIKLTASDRALLRKLDMEHRERMEATKKVEGENKVKITAIPNPKSRQTLSASAKQRTVPASRVGRMASFGSLAAGLGLGTVAEFTRRSLGIGSTNESSNLLLTEANMERIVDTLCKVRGAALKIGQILSIQEDSVVNPQLSRALERVRRSADFMPQWQLERVLSTELGANWRDNFEKFDGKPFAAASIGQVHWGKTKGGREVAIKIQYPGVARGIESDIDNLFGVLKFWNVFPEGMFINNLVLVAKRELAWEVDYKREAECTRRFKKLLEPYSEYYVPEVYDDLSTDQVFTTELLEGIPVDECVDLDAGQRKYIASKILELILREIFEFNYMQTDPNWANFLYNPETKRLLLLDFGASREYSKSFVEQYIKIIKAASDDDRENVLKASREIGFLTGYESKIMENAHVDAVMILGEIFRYRGDYDFTRHNTTERLKRLIPTVITHRLCPPPEEIYSLHRKLSGIFMLCVKLKTSVPARDIFLKMYSRYKATN